MCWEGKCRRTLCPWLQGTGWSSGVSQPLWDKPWLRCPTIPGMSPAPPAPGNKFHQRGKLIPSRRAVGWRGCSPWILGGFGHSCRPPSLAGTPTHARPGHATRVRGHQDQGSPGSEATRVRGHQGQGPPPSPGSHWPWKGSAGPAQLLPGLKLNEEGKALKKRGQMGQLVTATRAALGSGLAALRRCRRAYF